MSDGQIFPYGHYSFIKKTYSTLSKNEPACMYKEGWCLGLRQEGVVCVRVWELSEIPLKKVE